MNQAPANSPTILLIEDSETQALLFSETLSAAGMPVHRVASAEEALEYLELKRPMMAVVDYHLPGMQGDEFCRTIRDNATTASLPLLVLTDEIQADAERYALDCGADDYVSKSSDSDVLLARIDLLARRTRSRGAVDEDSFYEAQRVLIVDDSPTYLAFLAEELSRDGYRILSAASGEEALQLARQNHIDCAVIDLVMPGMDGIELCRHLIEMRQPGRAIPVLIVTAQGSKDLMMESLEVGADDFVEKSGDSTVLRARLRAVLRRKMLQDAHQRIQDEIHEKERQLANERARNEVHLRALLDNAADGIVTIGGDGNVRVFNQAAEKIFGCRSEQIVGRSFSALMPAGVADPYDGDIGRLLAEFDDPGTVDKRAREVDARRADGSIFPAEFSVGGMEVDDERVFVGIICDVTERRQAQEALRAADEQVHLLLGSMGEGLYGVDVEGRVTFVNRAAMEMLGFEEADLLGRSAHQAFHHTRPDGSAYPEAECENLSTIKSGQTREAAEDVLWTKAGTALPVQLSSRPIHKNDRLIGAVVSFQDVSGRKHLEEQLRQSQKMEAVGRLTGGVAHDFNNLLTVIMGNLDLLTRSVREVPGAAERIEKVLAAAESGADLTRRLLTFSRQQVLETGDVDINELVQGIDEMLGRTMGENIVISTELCAEACLGRTDRNQLEHALLNLAVNARHAMPEGGTLTIETRRVVLDDAYAARNEGLDPGDYVEIAVSDTGIGIPPEVIDKIFDPFFTTKPKGEGTGLGLSTIFGFMKQSGGHVGVYSEVGHGTTFRLYVPDAGAHDAGDARAGAAAIRNGANGRTANILVVEDEDDVREIAVSILAEAGHQVFEATDGNEGLEAFAAHPDIDVVFSDVIMPGGVTGPQMVDSMRERRPDLPVLFASGYAAQALRDRETLNAYSMFIPKPYDSTALCEHIAALLEVVD